MTIPLHTPVHSKVPTANTEALWVVLEASENQESISQDHGKRERFEYEQLTVPPKRAATFCGAVDTRGYIPTSHFFAHQSRVGTIPARSMHSLGQRAMIKSGPLLRYPDYGSRTSHGNKTHAKHSNVGNVAMRGDEYIKAGWLADMEWRSESNHTDAVYKDF